MNTDDEKFQQIRQRAEDLLRRRGRRLNPDNWSDIDRLFEELEVSQIELELQNEELLNAQSELLASRNKYNDLYDVAPIGYVTVDSDHKILELNLTGAHIFGVERSSMIGRPLTKFISFGSQDEYYLKTRQMLGSRTKGSFEVSVVRTDGTELPVQIEGISVTDSSGSSTTLRLAFMDIADRKKTEQQLMDALHDKEMLIKEIHHRIKNNLLVIQSLLRLQSVGLEEGDTKDLLRESENRIKSMSMIHERLYNCDDLKCIDAGDYFKSLVKALYSSYALDPENVSLELEIQNMLLDIDTMIPCALIVNELVSNSFKYAFPSERKGVLGVSFARLGDGCFRLRVSDDGPGLPENFDIDELNSLGMTIVTSLVDQLNGSLQYSSGEKTEFTIEFQCKAPDTAGQI